MNLFLGPLWGQVEILEFLKPFLDDEKPITFYGGYLHFSDSRSDVIEKLSIIKMKYPHTIFSRSRFETELLILAGLAQEKNYHFKRWVNPFSGIFSCIKYYELSEKDFLNDPEKFSEKLKQKIIINGHLGFYQSLIDEKINQTIMSGFEAEITSFKAFNTINLYDNDTKLVSGWKSRSGIISSYLKYSQSILEEFANGY